MPVPQVLLRTSDSKGHGHVWCRWRGLVPKFATDSVARVGELRNRHARFQVSTISSARWPARPRDAVAANRLQICSCFVHISLLDHRHGSFLFDSPETPAGA